MSELGPPSGELSYHADLFIYVQLSHQLEGARLRMLQDAGVGAAKHMSDAALLQQTVEEDALFASEASAAETFFPSPIDSTISPQEFRAPAESPDPSPEVVRDYSQTDEFSRQNTTNTTSSSRISRKTASEYAIPAEEEDNSSSAPPPQEIFSPDSFLKDEHAGASALSVSSSTDHATDLSPPKGGTVEDLSSSLEDRPISRETRRSTMSDTVLESHLDELLGAGSPEEDGEDLLTQLANTAEAKRGLHQQTAEAELAFTYGAAAAGSVGVVAKSSLPGGLFGEHSREGVRSFPSGLPRRGSELNCDPRRGSSPLDGRKGGLFGSEENVELLSTRKGQSLGDAFMRKQRGAAGGGTNIPRKMLFSSKKR